MGKLPYIMVYVNWLKSIERLKDSERGRLFTALLKYGDTGEEPPLEGNEGYVFDSLKLSIDLNNKAYEEKCRKNRENGMKAKHVHTEANAPRSVATAYKEKEEEKEEETTKASYLYGVNRQAKEVC